MIEEYQPFIILLMHEGCIFFPLIKKLSILETWIFFIYIFFIYTLFYIVVFNTLLFIMILNQSHDLKFHVAQMPQIILQMKYLKVILKYW